MDSSQLFLQVCLFDLSYLLNTQICMNVSFKLKTHVHALLLHCVWGFSVCICFKGWYYNIISAALSWCAGMIRVFSGILSGALAQPTSRFWRHDAMHAVCLEVYMFMKYKTNKIRAFSYMIKQCLHARTEGVCRQCWVKSRYKWSDAKEKCVRLCARGGSRGVDKRKL